MLFRFGSFGLFGNGWNFGSKLGDPSFDIILLEHVVTSIHVTPIHAQNPTKLVQFEVFGPTISSRGVHLQSQLVLCRHQLPKSELWLLQPQNSRCHDSARRALSNLLAAQLELAGKAVLELNAGRETAW